MRSSVYDGVLRPHRRPTLRVDIQDNTINTSGAPWSGEGITVGSAAQNSFTGSGSFDSVFSNDTATVYEGTFTMTGTRVVI